MDFIIKRLSNTQKIVLGFGFVIFFGAVLLALPISQTGKEHVPFFHHLFTATSMVSVTGLSVLSVGDVYNTFGQIICMFLMQIGGLGWITVMTLLVLTLGEKLSLKDHYLLQDSLNRNSAKDIKHYLIKVYHITLIVEGIASLMLMIDFVPRFGWFDGVFNALFTSVSAFCNAGFDNLGGASLQMFVSNPLVNIVVAVLIISGGLGFLVWYELYQKGKEMLKHPKRPKLIWRSLSVHAKIVLLMTASLIMIGTLLTFLSEQANHQTFAKMDIGTQVLASFFQSVTMRTAGFATLDYSQTLPLTNFIFILLMLIGGAPGGTAGGLKVTTIALILFLVRTTLKGKNDVVFAYRRIAPLAIKQALTMIVFFFSVLLVGYASLLLFNPHLMSTDLWFEAVSAIATVGVTTGITAQLSAIGQAIIMLLMFIGRVGALTVLLSFASKKEKDVQYAQADILIG